MRCVSDGSLRAVERSRCRRAASQSRVRKNRFKLLADERFQCARRLRTLTDSVPSPRRALRLEAPGVSSGFALDRSNKVWINSNKTRIKAVRAGIYSVDGESKQRSRSIQYQPAFYRSASLCPNVWPYASLFDSAVCLRSGCQMSISN